MSNENAIYGKKVFFLYPNYTLQTAIMEQLRTLEYEVYIINDYKDAKNILIKNHDSIFYLNPDGVFSPETWANYLKTIAEDSRFASISLGIITEKLDDNYKNILKSSVDLKAGLITQEDPDTTLHAIIKQLDANGAKGMRQYVRANCLSDKTAEIFWLTDSNIMHKMKIIDISSVGLAISLTQKQTTMVQVNQIIPNACLMLKAKEYRVDVKVTAIKSDGKNSIAVLMLRMDNSPQILTAIRAYVANTLFNNIMDSIMGLPRDNTDYVVRRSSKPVN